MGQKSRIPQLCSRQSTVFVCPLSVSHLLWRTRSHDDTSTTGFVKWYSRLYRNQGSLIFAPSRLDWSEQIVVLTGGASGIGELLANTLAVRGVTVVVLDIKPIITENRMLFLHFVVSLLDFVQITFLTISVMFLNGKRSKPFPRISFKRSAF